MVIMITYDLNGLKDYPRLFKAIGELGETIRDPGLDSVWLVNTTYTMKQIENHLLNAIDANDRIFFCRISSQQERGGWLHNSMWTWIDSRI